MSDEARSPEEDFGVSAVRELLRLISDTDITELKIERGDTKLHIKRGMSVQQQALLSSAVATMSAASAAPSGALPQATFHPQLAFPPPVSGALPTPEPSMEPPLTPGSQIITSPMVGTFYTAASPKDPPFAHEGDLVQVGEVVGIVEAMKIMNEIDSEYAGRIVKIYVTNGQPVEYGQPLMVVEPT